MLGACAVLVWGLVLGCFFAHAVAMADNHARPGAEMASYQKVSATSETVKHAAASGLETTTVSDSRRVQARKPWLPELTSTPAELIPPVDETDLPPPSGASVLVFVFDRYRLKPVSGLTFYAVAPSTRGGTFVTNRAGFMRVTLAPGHENDAVAELELRENYMPYFDGPLRLLPSNDEDRRFRLPLERVARDTVLLMVVSAVRAEVAVYELPYRRMINVPVTLTPLDAITRDPLTLPAGAEDELVVARFCIPACEGDTYRVRIGENVNTGAMDIGTFTVRAYRDPIQLRINLYAGPPPLEVITTEH
jgi:hypothetical protein